MDITEIAAPATLTYTITVANTGNVSLTGVTLTDAFAPVSYTHLRAHETVLDLVCRLLLEKKKKTKQKNN